MRDLAIQAAGVLAIFAAVVHGILGETRVFSRAQIQPARIRLLVRLVWQCSAVAWAALGVLLFAVPYLRSDAARLWIIGAGVATFGFAAVANAWATKGKHYGWMVLTLATALAVVGAFA